VWKQVVKAEVVGPVTLLNWSFPRADRSHREQCLQLGTHSKHLFLSDCIWLQSQLVHRVHRLSSVSSK
jgi:hypothetical protein